MPDTNDNDIDSLLRILSERKTNGCYFDQRYHAALTALVAERDKLAERLETERNIRHLHEQLASEKTADRNRRDDLVCSLFPILLAAAWSRQTASTTAAEMAETHAAMRELALVEADKMLAAMRKGDTNAK